MKENRINAEIMKAPHGACAIATMTFDDGVQATNQALVGLLEEYGLKASLMLVPHRIEGNYDKVSVSVLRVKDFDEEEIEMYRDYTLSYFENRYAEFNMDDITDYKSVKLKMTVVEDGDRDSTTMELILVKYKGKWKIVNPQLL